MDRNNSYRLGLYEKAMPDFDSWEQKLSLTSECGFDWLEISIDESEKKQSRIYTLESFVPELRRAIANTGIPVHTMCLSGHRKYPLGSEDEGTRKKSLDIMKRALELSSECGIRIIQLAGYDVYYEEHSEATEAYFKEGLYKCVEMAASAGVCLGFETMETPFMDTVEKSMKYVSLINSPYLGVYPDIGNLKNASVLYNSDVVDDLKKGAARIFAAHLKETKPGVYRDMLFGTTGHTEYSRCIEQLWSQGVRMYTGEFWYHKEENYKKNICAASAFLRFKIENACQPNPLLCN